MTSVLLVQGWVESLLLAGSQPCLIRLGRTAEIDLGPHQETCGCRLLRPNDWSLWVARFHGGMDRITGRPGSKPPSRYSLPAREVIVHRASEGPSVHCMGVWYERS
jgi:hypothetical protein